MFPMDRWYVGALGAELQAGQLLGRTLLEHRLVFFRDDQGRATALEDRCSHRGLPLSMGCVEGGRVRCGYHGLLFDGGGRCIEIPGQADIPERAAIRRHEVREQDGLLWVWFPRQAGAPARGEPPRWGVMADPAYRMRGAALHYAAPWQLIHDNLLDLTHAGYVHTKTIGGNPKMHSMAPTQVTQDGDVVRVQRRLPDSPPPATFLAAWPFEGRVDRWQEIEFHVDHVRIFAGATDAGSAAIEPLPPEARPGLRLPSFHAVTPETATSCHYVWMVGCNSPRDGVIDSVFEQFHATFAEDKLVIEAQHRNLLHFADAPRISAHFDKAPTMARRIVERLSR